MPGINDKMGESSGNVPQPRQPSTLQGLLRFAMETTQSEDARGGESELLPPMNEERRRFLEEAVKAMTVDVIDLLQKQIKVLVNADRLNVNDDVTEYATSFANILEHVDSIDVANDFHKIGGFTVFQPCLRCRHPQVRADACELLAELCQNNPYCQRVAINNRFVPLLLEMVNKREEEDTVCVKALYAISCICRENQEGFNQFVQYGGPTNFLQLLRRNNDKIRTKITFMLSALCRCQSDFKSRLIFLEYVPCLISLLSEPRQPSHEHILSLLLNLVEENPTAQAECKNPEYKFDQLLKDYLASIRNKDECLEEEQYCRKLIRLLQYG